MFYHYLLNGGERVVIVYMWKKLNQLDESYFFVFRGPIDSGRQRPESLAGTLLFAPLLLIGLLVLANIFVFMDRIEPAHPGVIIFCIILSVIGGIITLLSFIYSFKGVYETRQSTQYMITIWVSQFLFGHLLYWLALYIVFDGKQFHHYYNIDGHKMILFIVVTFLAGIGLFLYTFTRLVHKIVEGEFQQGTKRAQLRSRMEMNTDELKRIGIQAGVGLSLTFISLVKLLNVNDLQIVFISSIGITLFFVMWIILPEQIVTWYCIKRFDRFKFKEDADSNYNVQK